MTDTRFGEDWSTKVEVHELKNYLVAITKPQADKDKAFLTELTLCVTTTTTNVILRVHISIIFQDSVGYAIILLFVKLIF